MIHAIDIDFPVNFQRNRTLSTGVLEDVERGNLARQLRTIFNRKLLLISFVGRTRNRITLGLAYTLTYLSSVRCLGS